MVGMLSAIFVASIEQTVVSTALNTIVAEIGGFELLGWVLAAYLLASTVLMPIYGKLGDMYGRRRMLLVGLTIFIIGSYLCGISRDLGSLIAFRVIQGVGGGAILPIVVALAGDLYPSHKRGRVQGLVAAIFLIAAVIGPVAGGWITENMGWPWIFFINIPIAIAAMLIVWRTLPRIRAAGLKPHLDIAGAVLLTLGIGALIAAFELQREVGLTGPVFVVLCVIAVVGTVAFILVERVAPEPILPLGLFGNRIFSIGMVLAALTGGSLFTAAVYLPLFAQQVLGRSPQSTSELLGPFLFANVLGVFIGGLLYRHIGARVIIAAGLGLSAAGTLLMATLQPETALWSAMAIVVLAGIGVGAATPAALIVVQDAVPHQHLGVVSSNLTFMRSLGGTIAVSLLGVLLTAQVAVNVRAAVAEALPRVEPAVAARVSELGLEQMLNPESQRAEGLPEELIEEIRNGAAGGFSNLFLITAIGYALAIVPAWIFLRPVRSAAAGAATERAFISGGH
jgi:EmrB/QacA subfamily drug resistance transporter